MSDDFTRAGDNPWQDSERSQESAFSVSNAEWQQFNNSKFNNANNNGVQQEQINQANGGCLDFNQGNIYQSHFDQNQGHGGWEANTGSQGNWQSNAGSHGGWEANTGSHGNWQQNTGRHGNWESNTGNHGNWERHTGNGQQLPAGAFPNYHQGRRI